MGFVTSGWQALKQTVYQIGRPGRFTLATSIFHNLNGLFEALTGKAAPAAGVRTVVGHDHSLNDGYPIYRSYVGGFDTGETVGYLLTSVTAVATPVALSDKSPSLRCYINPAITSLLAGPPTLEAKAYVVLTNTGGTSSNFEFVLRNVDSGENSSTTTEIVSSGTTVSKWITISGIGVGNGGWQGYDLLGGFTGTNGNILVTACIIAETDSTVAASTGAKYDSSTATTRP